jgi:hypothetical protein
LDLGGVAALTYQVLDATQARGAEVEPGRPTEPTPISVALRTLAKHGLAERVRARWRAGQVSRLQRSAGGAGVLAAAGAWRSVTVRIHASLLAISCQRPGSRLISAHDSMKASCAASCESGSERAVCGCEGPPSGGLAALRG